MQNTLRLTVLFLAALTGACAGDTASATLSLGFAGLPELGDGYVYEGWLIVGGSPTTAGRFTVDADGNPSPDVFDIDSALATAAETFVLTIEPATGDEPAPSSVHILAGDISASGASLTVSHPSAIGTAFADAAGQFILETPTSASVEDDYENGLWFLVPSDTGMAPGLVLPELPAGWIYEGWVAGAQGPVSTGRFRAVDEADSDGAGATAGPDGHPPFPGQDFIDPARILTSGYAAVISVEPVPDNSPLPFVIKPLVDTSMSAVMAPTTQSMVNMAADNIPSGSITLGFAD